MMEINWIGLWTMVRRELQRLMRVPIQAVVAPLISALLFIFIFGFVLGGRHYVPHGRTHARVTRHYRRHR